MHTKQSLKEVFSKNVVHITFKKVDGADRKMKCTLKPEFLPEQKESTRKKPENDNVLPVWDLNLNAFRSFRVDSLVNYELDIS